MPLFSQKTIFSQLNKNRENSVTGCSFFSFLFLLLFITGVMSSCMIGPDYQQPNTRVEKNWVDHQDISEKNYGETEVYWWKSFHDPNLTKLIEVAYKNSPTLQMAGVKILQERAALNEAIGNLLPQQQGVSGGVNYLYIPGVDNNTSPLSNLAATSLGGSSPSLSSSIFSNNYFFFSSWELDFWGKYRRQIQSNKALFLETIVSYDDALVTLISEVALDYFLIRIYQEQLRITESNVELQKQSLKITEARFQGGQISKLDVEQAQTELSQTESDIPKIKNTIRLSKNALAFIMGLTPNEIDPLIKPGKLPTVPDSLTIGIPHDLLRQRPDVRAAGFAAISNCALLGVAETELLPSFSLAGNFGSSSSDMGNQQLMNIFNWQNAIVSAGGSFTMPILNYGRIVNQIRVSDATLQTSILNYQNIVLEAQAEVESGLSSYYRNKESMKLLATAVKSATSATHLANVRYIQGQANYTTVLTAEQEQLQVENEYISAAGNAILGVVATYRSLGGGWQLREGNNIISESVRKEMAARNNWGNLLKTKGQVPKKSPEKTPYDQFPKKRPLWNLLNINK